MDGVYTKIAVPDKEYGMIGENPIPHNDMKDWFGGDTMKQLQNITGILDQNSAAYLQYVDMATKKED